MKKVFTIREKSIAGFLRSLPQFKNSHQDDIQKRYFSQIFSQNLVIPKSLIPSEYGILEVIFEDETQSTNAPVLVTKMFEIVDYDDLSNRLILQESGTQIQLK